DGHVTGVQTCALPIYIRDRLSRPIDDHQLRKPEGTARLVGELPILRDREDSLRRQVRSHVLGDEEWFSFQAEPFGVERLREQRRSEERRVGKECRYWW